MRSLLRSPLMYYLRLPMPLRMLLLIGAGGGSIYMLTRFFRGRSMWIIMIGMVFVGFLLVGFRALLKWRKKRKAAPMEQGIVEQSAATPQSITEAGRRARLDDLRRNFEAGIQKFRAAGKDLYSLPWFVVVGEPGSGKTEAIRHCNVGFPPGLQDPFQGAGGTINMNWWFTNKAVILDTAGRLMFEEVEAGTTSEWEEFLKLLRMNRPTCPVNGLFLVIPADTLITDTADAIKAKAEKIAQQLDVIRRQLEVRFPVFVVITKCDLVNGFREFFENVSDPALQHQMLGWSNPAPLDEQFNPELVDQHLETVCGQLRRRRLGLLIDPVHTQDPAGGRRIDEADALFAFPQSLTRITSRLKLYLEIVFAGGAWSGKPLFLRGIYFTSAMREGSALDEELADALGVPVESLPDGRVWERDKSYFLRDVFIEKAFKEKGLVTRATDARKQHRRRKAVVLGAGFLAILVLGFFTWFGAQTLKKSIGIHRNVWAAAARKENWKPNKVTTGSAYWRPIVTQEYMGSPNWVYSGKTTLKVGQEKVRTAGLYDTLLKLADEPIQVPWIFWLARIGTTGLAEKRQRAHRILFEAGVLRPLVDASRKKMLEDTGEWPAEANDALAQLIRLEAPKQKLPRLDPLFQIVLRRAAQQKAKKDGNYAAYRKDRESVGAALKWIYTKGGGQWPPDALGTGGDYAHKAIHAGVDRFIRHWAAQGRNASAALDRIIDLRDILLQKYKDAEANLLKVDDEFAPRLERLTGPEAEVVREATGAWETRLAQLQQTKGETEAKLAQFPEGPLWPTFQSTSSNIVKEIESAFNRFRKQAGVSPRGGTAPAPEPGGTLLDKMKAAMKDKLGKQKPLPPGRKPSTNTAATRDKTAPGAELKRPKIIGEVDGKLAAALEQVRKIAQPAQIADDVRRVDLEFLNQVDVEERLWQRLVALDLIKRAGDNRKLRLYEFRLLTYLFADAERTKRDTAPEDGSFRQAIQTVRSNIERACNQLGELRDVDAKAYRFAEAADVAIFVSRRLSLRQRIYHMLASLLERAPKKDEEVAAHVEARAQKLRPMLKPTILLTHMQGGHFDPKHHPGAVLAILAACRDAGTVLEDKTVEVLERDKLAALWQKWQAVCHHYVEDAYFRYWTQQVPSDLESHAESWKGLRKELKETDPLRLRIFVSLGDVGQAMSTALGNDLIAMLPPAAQAKFEQARKGVAESAKMLQNPVYQSRCKQVRGNWGDLHEDAFEARNILVPLPRDKIFEDYAPFFPKAQEEFADWYWRGLTHEALRRVIADAGVDGLAAYRDLVRNYTRFPLDRPRQGEKPLTHDEVSKARVLIDKLVLTTHARGTKAESKDEEPARREIDRLLKELRELRIDPKVWAWVQKLKAVVDGLPSAGKRLKCEVWIVKAQEHPAVDDKWAHVRSRQGADDNGKGATWPPQDLKLCDLWYPGERFELRFHRHPSDPVKGLPPNRTFVVEGPWAPLRLLHPGEVTDQLYKRWQFLHKWRLLEAAERKELFDPKSRDIVITIEDDQKIRRQLRIRLKLDKGLPQVAQWPTKPSE